MSSEANFAVTFKQGSPPLITVRADSADEWKANLVDAESSGALTAIKAINDSLNGVKPGPTQAAPGGPQGSQVQPSASAATAGAQSARPAQELPANLTGNPKCETCGADTTFAKEGISQKSGRPYKRFSCSANQLHPATFI